MKAPHGWILGAAIVGGAFLAFPALRQKLGFASPADPNSNPIVNVVNGNTRSNPQSAGTTQRDIGPRMDMGIR